MTRNMTIGIVSGVATAIALGLLFGTEKGKETYQRALDKYKGNKNNISSELEEAAKDAENYPNKTSKTVAE